jgi:hypothetical protein
VTFCVLGNASWCPTDLDIFVQTSASLLVWEQWLATNSAVMQSDAQPYLGSPGSKFFKGIDGVREWKLAKGLLVQLIVVSQPAHEIIGFADLGCCKSIYNGTCWSIWEKSLTETGKTTITCKAPDRNRINKYQGRGFVVLQGGEKDDDEKKKGEREGVKASGSNRHNKYRQHGAALNPLAEPYSPLGDYDYDDQALNEIEKNYHQNQILIVQLAEARKENQRLSALQESYHQLQRQHVKLQEQHRGQVHKYQDLTQLHDQLKGQQGQLQQKLHVRANLAEQLQHQVMPKLSWPE